MRLVLWLLAGVTFLLPIGLIGALLLWIGQVMVWKQHYQNLGMKLPASQQFSLDLADFATTYFPAIGTLIVVFCWIGAAGLGALALRWRSPEARG